MKITVVAATGGIGRHLLDQALAAGHQATVLVRNPDRLTPEQRASDRIRVVTTDLADPDPAAVERAVAGADAVLSGLGARSNAEAGVAERGTRALVRAMRSTGTRRIVVVSAAPVGTVPSPGRPTPPRYDPGDGFLMRHLFGPAVKAALRPHYADLARMEDELRSSGLDWTVVRPPRLTDGPATGTSRTALGQNVRGGWTVPRAEVARRMLRLLDDPQTVREVIAVAR
ncbi:NAD(P)-binding oxidoreductase [Kitasatospora sp. NPDC085895]|uniref:NAD(P)-dependent oxidoreductase n=1 Tax=Kitasatospora sp. NPDC085895 TaxID=3155057 RepID=UPI00344DD1F1